MPVTLRSYSKINLGLLIGPTRPDGFHALTTLYQTLNAHDLVTVSIAPKHGQPHIEISCNDRRVPLDARNTVWKMLALALAVPGREGLRVRVHLEKHLPVQGGLGGGSGNAVAALLGLERELVRQGVAGPLLGSLPKVFTGVLTGPARLRLAAEVGSDVPLFLLGGSVLGLGRGEQVVPLADLPEMEAVLALPEVGVSTPAAFRAWDLEQTSIGLTPGEMADRLNELSRALASAWVEQHATGVLASGSVPRNTSSDQGLAGGPLLSTLVQTGILPNDFEQVVFRQHPLFEQIKRALAGQSSGNPAVYAALSGSGSAVFGLYRDEAGALAAEERLNGLGIRNLRTRTIRRAAYWADMVVDER
jgi:4-diphosphocytidyl-2-C-methyl-D-erythritol kinase